MEMAKRRSDEWLLMVPQNCHLDRSVPGFPVTRHSPTPACAAFSKESRMKFANATNLHRKSGVAQWRDLRFLFPVLTQTPLGPARLSYLVKAFETSRFRPTYAE